MTIAPADDEQISSLGPAAADVLTANIQSDDGEAFFRNLTSLARIDGCSEPPNEGLNCFATLNGVEDALELIFEEERKRAGEKEVLGRGWGKPHRNQEGRVGLGVTYFGGAEEMYSVLISVEPRRPQYVHPPLQTVYLPSEQPFVSSDTGMFELGPTSSFLAEQVPNWLEQGLDAGMDLIAGANCSLLMELNPPVVVSVEAARKICEIVAYGGWGDVLSTVAKQDWTMEDTTLEELLVSILGDEADSVWWDAWDEDGGGGPSG